MKQLLMGKVPKGKERGLWEPVTEGSNLGERGDLTRVPGDREPGCFELRSEWEVSVDIHVHPSVRCLARKGKLGWLLEVDRVLIWRVWCRQRDFL